MVDKINNIPSYLIDQVLLSGIQGLLIQNQFVNLSDDTLDYGLVGQIIFDYILYFNEPSEEGKISHHEYILLNGI